MFDFLTDEELIQTAEIAKEELRLRVNSIVQFRNSWGSLPSPLKRVASGHDAVHWEMQLIALEQELKNRGIAWYR